MEAPDIRLYHCPTARSFRVLWTLEEMRLPYELIVLPFPPRVHAREYLAINPLGTVPTMFDGETRMTESVAICQYLVDRYGPTALSVPIHDEEYGSYLNWMYFGEATLTTPLAVVVRYTEVEPSERRLPQAVEDWSRFFFGRLRAVESALATRELLCAGRLTLADISVGLALMTAEYLGLADGMGPNVRRYWQRLQGYESFRRSVARSPAGDAGTPLEHGMSSVVADHPVTVHPEGCKT